MFDVLADFDRRVAALPYRAENECRIDDERDFIAHVAEHCETAAIFYAHYVATWLEIHAHAEEGDWAISLATEYWDEGFWAAPGDWVQVPSALKLAHEGCRQAWMFWAQKGPVEPLPAFGDLATD